jgi:hypothetical protein
VISVAITKKEYTMKTIIALLILVSFSTAADIPEDKGTPPVRMFVDSVHNVVCYYMKSPLTGGKSSNYSYNMGYAPAISCVALPSKKGSQKVVKK